MPFWPAAQAGTLYLLPLLAFAGRRLVSSRSLPHLAVDLSCAVALDLLAILFVARFVRLDAAVFVVRAAWAVPTALSIRHIIRERAAFPGKVLVLLLAAGALAFLASAWHSHPFAPWDRQWHIPLTASMRGQSLPFVNVYQPALALGYHVSGNALAAALQALSAARLHSSAALSLAHDLMFALTGVGVAALIVRPGAERWVLRLAPVLPAAVLFAGPIAIGAARGAGFNNGFSYFNFYELSFRPHVVLAGLLIVGIAAGVFLTADYGEQDPPAWRTLVRLVPSLALFAITDEPSAGILLPALIAATLLSTRALPSVKSRLGWGVVWPATVGVALLVFPSTFGGNAAKLPVRITPPHLPSLFAPPMSLLSLRGLATMLADFAPMLGVLTLAVAAIRRHRTRRSAIGPIVIFGALILVIATGLLTTLVVANSPGESHRFMTLPMVTFPLLGLYLVPELSRRMQAALGIVLVTPVVFSLIWSIGALPVFRQFAPDRYAVGIHRMDCRDVAGARLFESVRPTYAPASTWYAWAGCHPIVAPGRSLGVGQRIDVGRPVFGTTAVERLSAVFVAPEEDLVVACPTAGRGDPVCSLVPDGSCVPAGSDWRACRLGVRERSAVLTSLR